MGTMRSYQLKLRVYYEDTDAGGVVYHARYLAFAERARTEALREAGVPHDELVTQFGLIFVVRRLAQACRVAALQRGAHELERHPGHRIRCYG